MRDLLSLLLRIPKVIKEKILQQTRNLFSLLNLQEKLFDCQCTSTSISFVKNGYIEEKIHTEPDNFVIVSTRVFVCAIRARQRSWNEKEDGRSMTYPTPAILDREERDGRALMPKPKPWRQRRDETGPREEIAKYGLTPFCLRSMREREPRVL